MTLAPDAPKRRGPRPKDAAGRRKDETHPKQIAARCTLDTFDQLAALRLALNTDNTAILEHAIAALASGLRGQQRKDYDFALSRARRLRKQ